MADTIIQRAKHGSDEFTSIAEIADIQPLQSDNVLLSSTIKMQVDWAPEGSEAHSDITVYCTAPPVISLAGHLVRFAGVINNTNRQFSALRTAIQQFRISYDILDRRVARRISRREGIKFKKVGKCYVFATID